MTDIYKNKSYWEVYQLAKNMKSNDFVVYIPPKKTKQYYVEILTGKRQLPKANKSRLLDMFINPEKYERKQKVDEKLNEEVRKPKAKQVKKVESEPLPDLDPDSNRIIIKTKPKNKETKKSFVTEMKKLNKSQLTAKFMKTKPKITNAKNVDETNDLYRSVFGKRLLTTVSKKFNITKYEYTLAPQDIIDYKPLNVPNFKDQISFTVTFEDGFETDIHYVHYRERIVEQVEQVCDSNTFGVHGAAISINVSHSIVNLATGGAAYNGVIPRTVEELRKKKSCITIKNDVDENKNLCFDMSCVMLDNIEKKEMNKSFWNDLIRNKDRKATRLAITIRKELNRPYDIGTGIDDFPLYEEHFKANFTIYQLDTLDTHIIYRTPFNEDKELKYSKNFFFIYYNNHYEPITNISAFLSVSSINIKTLETKIRVTECAYCKTCSCDKNNVLIKDVPKIYCEKCNRYFPSENCFEKHIFGKFNTCDELKKCHDCHNTYKAARRIIGEGVVGSVKIKHICGHVECMNCKEVVDLNTHKCYIKSNEKHLFPKKAIINGKTVLVTDKEKLKEINFNERSNRMGFFDFESMVNTVVEGDAQRKIHTVNLAVAYYYNDVNQAYAFKTVEEFIEWLFKSEHNGYIFYAHNTGKYDSKLILESILLRNTEETPKILKSNGRILSLEYKNVKICDTYCHFMSSLKALPETFGFGNEIQKGDFPHAFNTLENQDYIGEYPESSYYGLEQKSKKDKKELEEFLKEKYAKKETFNFQEELLKYCKDDVLVLLKAWKIYRELLFSLLKIDVCNYLTLASCAQSIHRQKFMLKNSIAVSCKPYKNQSKVGEEYLLWIEHTEKVTLQREYCIVVKGSQMTNKRYVDGYNESTKTAYEFLGCHFHGCNICHPNDIDNSTGTHYSQKYKETMDKINQIKKTSINVVHIWEHEFNEMKKTNKDLQTFLFDFGTKKSLNTRDAFFGGRTDCKKLYYKAQENEKIRYVDFTSLYPYVQKYKDYPIGHPTIYKQHEINVLGNTNEDIVNNCFGIIKCRVSCPKNKEIQVLPVRDSNLGKLIFPAYDEIIGTWSSIELQTFITEGGKILEIFEVHNFNNKNNEIFKDYVNFFLKIKQESSGYPLWVKNEKQKDEYIKLYFEKENIKLEKEKITQNDGLRSLSKLYLNSLWGRYAMNEDRDETIFIHEPEAFFRLLSDKNINVEFEVMGKDNNEFIVAVKKNVYTKNTFSTSDYIACFTTAHARLSLFNLMKAVGFENVIYHDTDSVIYVEKTDNKHIYETRLGDFLGELTDEIKPKVSEEREYITEVICLAPKTYSVKIERHLQGEYERNKKGEYKRDDDGNKIQLGYIEEIKTKSKGFTLNVENAKEFNHESMKNMLFEAIHNNNKEITIKTKQFTIKQVNHGLSLESVFIEKVMKFGYDKQQICENFNLLPLGFKK